jgi:hypothetical protein
MKIGLAVVAERGVFTVVGGVNGLFGDTTSTGIIPQLSVGYKY